MPPASGLEIESAHLATNGMPDYASLARVEVSATKRIRNTKSKSHILGLWDKLLY